MPVCDILTSTVQFSPVLPDELLQKTRCPLGSAVKGRNIPHILVRKPVVPVSLWNILSHRHAVILIQLAVTVIHLMLGDGALGDILRC